MFKKNKFFIDFTESLIPHPTVPHGLINEEQ